MRFISRILNSIMARLAFILGAMVAMTAAAVVISWMIFQSIDESMTALTNDRLPELRATAVVKAAADQTRSLLSDLLIVESEAALERKKGDVDSLMTSFADALEQLPTSDGILEVSNLSKVELSLANLLVARESELRTGKDLAAMVERAFKLADSVSLVLEEASDAALFDMAIRGEETIEVIDETLTKLVEEDFNMYQTVLEIRADVGLLSGLALTMSQTYSSGLKSIITDLANSSINRLRAKADENADAPEFSELLPVLQIATGIFETVFTSTGYAANSNEILAARLEVDQVLSPALDDIHFNLVIGTDDAKIANSQSIDTLLNVEVKGMREKAQLDAATKQFFAKILTAALARNEAELSQRQSELMAEVAMIQKLASNRSADTVDMVNQLVAFAAVDTGIANIRRQSFAAVAAASLAAMNAAAAVDAIALETSALSEVALDQIAMTAKNLQSDVDGAGLQLGEIAALSALLGFAAPVLVWAMVTRPLNRVTSITERLASGDLSEITGLRQGSGELGRLAAALYVFRDGALKTKALQEEEKRRDQAAIEAEREAERLRLEDERRQQDETAERERLERERKALEAEKTQRAQAEIEAERKERMQEQETIVSALAQGLTHLSAGDLTYQIKTKFPGPYEALRQDFNTAVSQLAEHIIRLRDSSGIIEDSSAHLAMASGDLGRRTETNAATLEKIANAIRELANSVSVSAAGATSADVAARGVEQDAAISRNVVMETKSAMAEVEMSFSKIISIVDVIDSIAFQTNLLALNAGVEAARAGQAGQGFAVVASEVRSLAQRCTEAASEINTVVKETNETVERGVALTSKADVSIATISEGIGRVSKAMNTIALSATEQSKNVSEVNDAVSRLDQATQKNAAMFEETAATNQSLAQEAKALTNIVSAFQINAETGDNGGRSNHLKSSVA